MNGTWAIVPVIDLFNHRWNANAKYRYEVCLSYSVLPAYRSHCIQVERHAHEGYTEQFFFPGEQLFFSYGRPSTPLFSSSPAEESRLGTCDHHSPTRFFMTYNFFDAYPLDRLSSDFQQEVRFLSPSSISLRRLMFFRFHYASPSSTPRSIPTGRSRRRSFTPYVPSNWLRTTSSVLNRKGTSGLVRLHPPALISSSLSIYSSFAIILRPRVCLC